MTDVRGAAVLAFLLAACAPSATVPSPTPRVTVTATATSPTPATLAAFPPSTDAATVDGGCGTTRAWRGSIPVELERAAGDNAPHGLPVVYADPPVVAGFIFGYPLRAGHPTVPSNKILWVVSGGRSGPLTVDAHPADAPQPAVHLSFPDDSGPGNIYPSGVDVPTAGCWHLTLAWSGHTAQLDLVYR